MALYCYLPCLFAQKTRTTPSVNIHPKYVTPQKQQNIEYRKLLSNLRTDGKPVHVNFFFQDYSQPTFETQLHLSWKKLQKDIQI